MKLAEALINRADAQKRVQQLRERLNRSVLVQEGEQPPEDPQELLAEMERVISELTHLIKRINRTNASTPFDAARTLTDALADRDAIMLERSLIESAVQSATEQNNMRYSRSEIKQVMTIDVRALQVRIDALSRDYRQLDSAIQQMNWQVDLLGA
ncbi:DIP1984 family protein [Phototrophicus methaneseepsis]|uniref:DIP1984 family protein n=1 Tax=Phototrophicus methaneseepsis TaxID=2710758 RepID=A0A7S8IFP1_9CHLR|nr:DIP1984 family protein [Phototrophicus methaneseepsis]QPC84930.1 DIP1984 family protein [Phototrophicus methaneseepsis]